MDDDGAWAEDSINVRINGIPHVNDILLNNNLIMEDEFIDAEVIKVRKVLSQHLNRVDDKICLKLSGIAFDIDDPLRPLIPDDTHPNCRCYYVDEETGAILTDISSRRDVRRRNELTNRQRKNIVRKVYGYSNSLTLSEYLVQILLIHSYLCD